MDLNRITAFARVVEEGSFTKAAIALGLPKSSISRNVSLLEEELGAKLLQRSSRRVVVTELGATYYARVGRALATIEEANTSAAEERAEPRGTIRIAAPPFEPSSDIFIPLIARFVAKHPLINVDVAIGARHVDLVAEGFDLAIRAGFVRDPSLIARKIANTHLALFAAASYVKARGAATTLANLRAQDAVLFHGQRGRVTWTLTNGERTETVDMTGRMNVDDIIAARSAVRQGIGIGMLAPMLVEDDLASGAFVRVLPDWYSPAAPLSVVYPSARFVPHRVALLRDYLIAELGKLDWTCRSAGHAKGRPKAHSRAKKRG